MRVETPSVIINTIGLIYGNDFPLKSCKIKAVKSGVIMGIEQNQETRSISHAYQNHQPIRLCNSQETVSREVCGKENESAKELFSNTSSPPMAREKSK